MSKRLARAAAFKKGYGMPAGLENTQYDSLDQYLATVADVLAREGSDSESVRMLVQESTEGTEAHRLAQVSVALQRALEYGGGPLDEGDERKSLPSGATRSPSTMPLAASFAVGGIMAAILVIAVVAVARPFPPADISALESAVAAEKAHVERIERVVNEGNAGIAELREELAATSKQAHELAGLVRDTRQNTSTQLAAIRNTVVASEKRIAGRVVDTLSQPQASARVANSIAKQLGNERFVDELAIKLIEAQEKSHQRRDR